VELLRDVEESKVDGFIIGTLAFLLAIWGGVLGGGRKQDEGRAVRVEGLSEAISNLGDFGYALLFALEVHDISVSLLFLELNKEVRFVNELMIFFFKATYEIFQVVNFDVRLFNC